ncbi:MarR family winged helix-turn-helix transcriptional regulator [Acrocarpospora macrocephala]|uniref:MarR family winged helix-turn-helix transcriptional regulator n=1 Tax=Acrocarpospora macrocephala TaxID=150177 RepID=UPI0012D2D42D|nr:MarR family transcriptional regulator [Acrocarpospora macrocephala]
MTKTGQAIAATGAAAGQEPTTDDTQMDVAAGLVQLTSLVQSMYARVSERHDLTPVQAKLLCILLDGPRGMAELARYFGVEKAALTGLTDRAERRGLAERTPVPGDRRATQVTLTDAGHQAAVAFHAEVTTELSRLISPLTPDSREHFRSAMAEIITECRAASLRGEC